MLSSLRNPMQTVHLKPQPVALIGAVDFGGRSWLHHHYLQNGSFNHDILHVLAVLNGDIPTLFAHTSLNAHLCLKSLSAMTMLACSATVKCIGQLTVVVFAKSHSSLHLMSRVFNNSI